MKMATTTTKRWQKSANKDKKMAKFKEKDKKLAKIKKTKLA